MWMRCCFMPIYFFNEIVMSIYIYISTLMLSSIDLLKLKCHSSFAFIKSFRNSSWWFIVLGSVFLLGELLRPLSVPGGMDMSSASWTQLRPIRNTTFWTTGRLSQATLWSRCWNPQWMTCEFNCEVISQSNQTCKIFWKVLTSSERIILVRRCCSIVWWLKWDSSCLSIAMDASNRSKIWTPNRYKSFALGNPQDPRSAGPWQLLDGRRSLWHRERSSAGFSWLFKHS